MAESTTVVNWIRCLAGAAIGGGVGYYVFGLILSEGFYAMIIPGAALGFGAGKLSRDASITRGRVCAVLAIGLGLFTEWKFFPFMKDGSLTYFLTHVHELRMVALLMIAAGGYFGYHYGIGNRSAAPRRTSSGA